MTTNTPDTGTLTEAQGNELFHKAYSEISGTTYKPSEFKDVAPVPDTPVPEKEPTPETPAAPAAVEAPPETPEKPVEEEAKPTTPTQPQQPQTREQLLEKFPEDQREAIRQLYGQLDLEAQRSRSTAGRLAKEQKQRQQVEQELVKLRSRGAARTQDPALAEQAKADYTKQIAEWQQLVEAEPTVAKAIDALTDAKVKDVQSELSKLRSELDSRDEVGQQHQFENEKQREWNTLIEAVPNAPDVIRSQEFIFWKDNIAPPGLKQLAESSIDHRDALFVLQQYSPYAMWVNEQRNGKPAPTNPAPAASTVADQISNVRQDKVSPIVQGGVVKPNTSAQPGNEFSAEVGEALFREAYKKITNKS